MGIMGTHSRAPKKNTSHGNEVLRQDTAHLIQRPCYQRGSPCQDQDPQWGAADAEIKVPSGENTELKRSPFQAWSRSVYSQTCYAYCQGFLPCLFLPLRSIHLHFFQNLSRFLLCWLWLTLGSCVGPQNKIGHPAGCRFPFSVPTKYKKAKKKKKKRKDF